jgi:hypothetical protein
LCSHNRRNNKWLSFNPKLSFKASLLKSRLLLSLLRHHSLSFSPLNSSLQQFLSPEMLRR